MKVISKLGILLTALCLVGCGGSSGGSGEAEHKEAPQESSASVGSLTLSMSDGVNTRLISPSWTEIYYYDISGNGPGEETFEELGVSARNGDVEVNNIASGEWTIQVVAKDLWNRDVLGGGEVTLIIERGKTAEAEIEIQPLTAPGTLTLDMLWTTENVATPVITAELMAADETVSELELSVNAETGRASYRGAHDPGYYVLSYQIFDGVELLGGGTEAVRILSGLTSEGEIVMDQIAAPEGNLNLSFVQDMNHPIEVETNSPQDNLVIGESVT